jgi:hypothetical protein
VADSVGTHADGDPVTRSIHLRSSLRHIAQFTWSDDRAAQIVEFAVALPLLVVFVVGIFDFSGAFTLKQKLTNVARDAARVAAADPANDLQSTLPASVSDAFEVVDHFLLANKLNDCGIVAAGPPVNLTWTFTAAGNGCPSPGLTIYINRGYYFPASGVAQPSLKCVASSPGAVIGTCVSIQYSYSWRFGRAASLLGGGGKLPRQITAAAVALNEN